MRQSFIIGFLLVSMSTFGQQNVEDYYDDLTASWMEVSGQLSAYDGLGRFCLSPEFRELTLNILHKIHHCDSLVLEFLNKPGTIELIGHHEYRMAMKEIDKIETKYSTHEFMAFLKQGCRDFKELERNKASLKAGIGQESYDGQILILESYIHKFLKHIDKRVKAIDKHIHKIHPDIVLYQTELSN